MSTLVNSSSTYSIKDKRGKMLMRSYIEQNPKRVIAFMEDTHGDINDLWWKISTDIQATDYGLVAVQFYKPRWERMLHLYKVFFPDEFELWEHIDDGYEYFKEDSYFECYFDDRWEGFAHYLERRHPELYGNIYKEEFIKLCERMGYKEGKKPVAIQPSLFQEA